MPLPLVEIRWDFGYEADSLLRELAIARTGKDPGPLHHSCPHCASITHGRPSYDACFAVSLARAGGLVVVAFSDQTPVGVDVATVGPGAIAWTRREAVAKARGTGILEDHDVEASDLAIREVELPQGYVGAVAVVTGGLGQQWEVRVARRSTTSS